MSGDDWSKEQEALKDAGDVARREEAQRRDERFNKVWQRDHPRPGSTRASAVAAALKTSGTSLRDIVAKSQAQDDDFTRLEKEVERGRPLSGLARHMYEVEKARRDGGSDAG
ncbi:hypothetical protein [Micromonospora sp. NPDC048898]|uniref:hypothetical protein n=1 Tax=Micromonospora sp. NPDC048898 TaxID=3364260 RepID=UPI0037107E0E